MSHNDRILQRPRPSPSLGGFGRSPICRLTRNGKDRRPIQAVKGYLIFPRCAQGAVGVTRDVEASDIVNEHSKAAGLKELGYLAPNNVTVLLKESIHADKKLRDD